MSALRHTVVSNCEHRAGIFDGGVGSVGGDGGDGADGAAVQEQEEEEAAGAAVDRCCFMIVWPWELYSHAIIDVGPHSLNMERGVFSITAGANLLDFGTPAALACSISF